MTYIIKDYLKPNNLKGISQNQIDDHWQLYVGYVNQLNVLLDELNSLRDNNRGAAAIFADRRRRLGFEFSGMVLHELYFEALKNGVSLDKNHKLVKKMTDQFGSFEKWKDDFINTGLTRSIGWAICYLDPQKGTLNNHFVQLHEEGNIPSFKPILVMDVWEHAYMVDGDAGGRKSYINAFMENINWDVVCDRYTKGLAK